MMLKRKISIILSKTKKYEMTCDIKNKDDI